MKGVLTRTPLGEGGWVLENRARRRCTGKEPLRRLVTYPVEPYNISRRRDMLLAAPDVEPSDTAAGERVHEFDL